MAYGNIYSKDAWMHGIKEFEEYDCVKQCVCVCVCVSVGISEHVWIYV